MISATPQAPDASQRVTYIGALLTAAIMAALAALLVIVLIMGQELSAALTDLEHGPDALLAHLHVIVTLVVGPLLCAAFAAFAMWRTIWVTRVTRYMRFIQNYCTERLHRDAPLLALGFGPVGQSLSVGDGHPATKRPAHDVLTSAQRTLLLGEAGSGKTTALLTTAKSLSGRPFWVRFFLGVRHESLPMLISLPGLARTLTDESIETAPSMTRYIATLLTRIGTDGLGARTQQLMRAGQLTLLCDDYDKLDDDERELLNQTFQEFSEGPYSACRVVVSCESSTYASVVDDLGPLAQFSACEIVPIPVADVSEAIRKHGLSARRRNNQEPGSFGLGIPLDHRPLGRSLRIAAFAAALAETQAAGEIAPWGRAELLRNALQLVSATATVRELEAAISQPIEDIHQQPALVWTALGAAMRNTRCGYVPLDPTLTVGESVFVWLGNHPPPGPTDFALSSMPEFTTIRIERDIQAGLHVGILRRSMDGLTLSFAHSLAQANAAAWWLDLCDDGMGRLNSQLLRPQWALPVALWTGAHSSPYDLAQRIFRFANSPDSIAPRAGMADRLDVYPQALALALAAALEGATPHLMRIVALRQTRSHMFLLAQQGLRDLLDACVVYGAEETQRRRLSRALMRTQNEVGLEFAAYLGALAREPSLDRMLRAQITTTLGLCATPHAIEELMSLLTQSDPTMRQAVEQAIVYAGANAIPALQTSARVSNVYIRQRAEEALRLLGDVAPLAGETAGGAAIASLNSPDAAQRRVAVTTLSAIGASQALNELITRLDDTNSEVRVAAAAALGQLGGRRALLALRRRATSDDAQLRLAVAQALGMDPSPTSVSPLLRLLKDREAQVRAAAATSLGTIADKRTIVPLREATEDADPWVRHAAQSAMRRLTHP